MHKELRYVNHLGEEIVFSYSNLYDTGYLVESDDLRDYEYGYDKQFDKISSFKKDIKKYKIPVVCSGKNVSEMANDLNTLIEKDVADAMPGKLYLGDYYLSGYFYGSKKTLVPYKGIAGMELLFVSDTPEWVNVKKYVFRDSAQILGDDHDYPYDYPFNYLSRVTAKRLVNNSHKPQDAIITIYGAVDSAVITINGYSYGADVPLTGLERLTINTKEKTVIKTDRYGEQINLFGSRVKDTYPFAKIPVGVSQILSPQTSNIDVDLLIERSEPEWI